MSTGLQEHAGEPLDDAHEDVDADIAGHDAGAPQQDVADQAAELFLNMVTAPFFYGCWALRLSADRVRVHAVHVHIVLALLVVAFLVGPEEGIGAAEHCERRIDHSLIVLLGIVIPAVIRELLHIVGVTHASTS